MYSFLLLSWVTRSLTHSLDCSESVGVQFSKEEYKSVHKFEESGVICCVVTFSLFTDSGTDLVSDGHANENDCVLQSCVCVQVNKISRAYLTYSTPRHASRIQALPVLGPLRPGFISVASMPRPSPLLPPVRNVDSTTTSETSPSPSESTSPKRRDGDGIGQVGIGVTSAWRITLLLGIGGRQVKGLPSTSLFGHNSKKIKRLFNLYLFCNIHTLITREGGKDLQSQQVDEPIEKAIWQLRNLLVRCLAVKF